MTWNLCPSFNLLQEQWCSGNPLAKRELFSRPYCWPSRWQRTCLLLLRHSTRFESSLDPDWNSIESIESREPMKIRLEAASLANSKTVYKTKFKLSHRCLWIAVTDMSLGSWKSPRWSTNLKEDWFVLINVFEHAKVSFQLGNFNGKSKDFFVNQFIKSFHRRIACIRTESVLQILSSKREF